MQRQPATLLRLIMASAAAAVIVVAAVQLRGDDARIEGNDVAPAEVRTPSDPCSPTRLRSAIERFLAAANTGHEGGLNSAIATEKRFRVYSHGLDYRQEPRRFFVTRDRQELIEHLLGRQAVGDRYWLRALDVNSYDRSFEVCNVGFTLQRQIGEGPVRLFDGKGALDARSAQIAVWNIGDSTRT